MGREREIQILRWVLTHRLRSNPSPALTATGADPRRRDLTPVETKAAALFHCIEREYGKPALDGAHDLLDDEVSSKSGVQYYLDEVLFLREMLARRVQTLQYDSP